MNKGAKLEQDRQDDVNVLLVTLYPGKVTKSNKL